MYRFSKKYLPIIIAAFTIFILQQINLFADNPLIEAMRDEIKRSMNGLHLESLKMPYYIEYKLTIKNSYDINASLGGIEQSNHRKVAYLDVNVRIGDYKADNSNFYDFATTFFGSGDEEEGFSNRIIQQELDYNTLRRELWLATDAAYKQSAETYTKKEAALKNRMRKDTTPDFTYLEPVKLYDTLSIPEFDTKKFENTAINVSSVFRDYPDIQISSVGIEYIPNTVYYVNSEGREYIKTQFYSGIEIAAITQAKDGMPLTNIYHALSLYPDDLPSTDSLVKSANTLAKKLDDIMKAPILEDAYSGPILFEGQAAAEIFAQVFAPNLVTQREMYSENGLQESDHFTAFQSKIGGRVLPEFLSVNAMPGKSELDNVQLLGHYKIDDEGVLAEDVNLVKDGYLKNLLSSRTPTKRVKTSNGHDRGGAPMISIIDISSEKKHIKTTKDQIKQMLKLCKDRELPYGIIVRRVINQNMLYTTLLRISGNQFPFPSLAQKIPLIEIYKVYQDGKEELVRGCDASGFTVQSFKDILNVGKNSYIMNYLAPAVASPYLTGGDQYIGATVIVPDLLFEDGDIKPIEGDFPKLPILSNPVAGAIQK